MRPTSDIRRSIAGMLGRMLLRTTLAYASFALACAGEESRATTLEADAGSRESGVAQTLPCVRAEPDLSVSADTDEAVTAGTSITYILELASRSQGDCEPEVYLVSTATPREIKTFRSEPVALESLPIAAGERTRLTFSIASGADEEPGSYNIDFFARERRAPGSAETLTLETHASYRVQEPDGCYIAPSRTLLIRHPSVVDDAVRAVEPGGVWTFGHLMQQLAPDASDMVEAMFRSFTVQQIINGFEVAPRPGMDPAVLAPWPRTASGKLDLARAPMRLLAIANRLDLSDLKQGRGGEGRFVFGVLAANGSQLVFTVILEYMLPAHDQAEFRALASALHALQEQPFPSEDYNAALEAWTSRYGALLRVRTNENDLGRDGRWEMREFRPGSKSLQPAPLAQTPQAAFNGSEALGRFILANQPSIETELHDVPAQWDGASFQAGALINNLEFWNAPGDIPPELRHKFSVNTCNGCHGGETGTSFFHVFPRQPGEASQLSDFLTGVTKRDPTTGEPRTYNELARRRQLLEQVVCPTL
jgi:hypothetical protein